MPEYLTVPNRRAAPAPRYCRPVLMGLLLSAVAVPALAQTSPDPAAVELAPVRVGGSAAKTGGPNLNTRSTAGSRLGLISFETPAAVDVVEGEAIRRSNPTDLNRALVENSVGLSFNGGHGSGGSTITMRGFSGHNSVTRLYDGIRLLPASASVTFPFDTWTVDRVEVLHGPAAVLYGAGGLGGAINFVAKKPLTDRTRREARVTAGSNGRVGLAWGSAGPINDRLAYSFDINTTRSDGERRGNATRSLAISGALRWQATDTLSVTASVDYGDNQPDTYFGTPLVNGVIDERTRWINYNVTDARIRYRDSITQLRAELTPGNGVTVRNTLYHVTSDRYWRNAESFTYLPATNQVRLSDYIAVQHDHRQTGNRLEAVFDGRLGGIEHTTTVGLDVNQIRFTNSNNSPYATPGNAVSIVDLLNPVGGGFGTHVMAVTTDTTTRRRSVFADSRLKFSEQFSLVAGVNFDRTAFTSHSRGDRGAFNSGNWRLGAVWNPTPDIAVYGQASYAKEALGNLLTQSAGNLAQVPTTGRQAEVGVKFRLPRGEATLAAYHIRQNNILTSDPNDRTKTLQIGQRSSRGIEAAIAYDLGAGVRINANAALMKARFDDFWSGTTNFSGNRVPNMPTRVANLQASGDINDSWQIRGGLHHVSSAFTNNQNTVTRPAYTVLNAGVQWRAAERVVVDLSITNLTDRIYANGGGSTKLNLAPGRTATLSVHTRF